MTKNFSSVPSITHSNYPEQERGNHEQTNLFSHSVFRDNDYLIGLFCLAASLTIFAITVNKEDFNSALSDSSFILNYFIALFYSILLLVNGKMRFFWKAQQKEFQPHRLLLWFIWLISCFGLNRLINIFNPSPIWLSVAIFISAGTSILYATEKFFPQFFQKLLYFLLGFSTILWAYYSIYLSRLYPISVLAFIFLGLSFHSFVPLLLLITHLRIIYQNWKKRQAAILAGLLLPTGFIIYFCIQWYIVSSDLQKTNNNAARKTESELPF